MEQQYKAFMDRQHPSKELIADTLKKAQAEDEKDESLKRKIYDNAGNLKRTETIGSKGNHVPQYVFAACAVLFVCDGSMKQYPITYQIDEAQIVMVSDANDVQESSDDSSTMSYDHMLDNVDNGLTDTSMWKSLTTIHIRMN